MLILGITVIENPARRQGAEVADLASSRNQSRRSQMVEVEMTIPCHQVLGLTSRRHAK